jgi:hypothetical protein
MALYGCQNFSSGDEAVRNMIYELSIKVGECKEELRGQAIGNALYGLKGMSSEHAEVRLLLRAFSSKIHQCNEAISPQNFGNALYGLQGCSSGHREVRDIVQAIASKLSECRDEFGGQELSNACYGLQGMRSSHAPVRILLRLLSQKLANTSTLLTGQQICNSFYGMNGMSCQHPEVGNMLNLLSRKLVEHSEPLGAQEQGNALYGLINSVKFGRDDTEHVIAYLLFGISNNMQRFSLFDLLDLFRSLSLLHFYNASELSPFMLDYVKHSQTLLDIAISEHKDNVLSSSIAGLLAQYGLNKSERKIADYVENYLQHHFPGAKLSRNEMLHGFEADIVIRLPSTEPNDSSDSGNGEETVDYKNIINIEVDGPLHHFPKKKIFTARRDAYLSQQFGYRIYRMDITTINMVAWEVEAEVAITELLNVIFKK